MSKKPPNTGTPPQRRQEMSDSEGERLVTIMVDRRTIEKFKLLGPNWRERMVDILDQAKV